MHLLIKINKCLGNTGKWQLKRNRQAREMAPRVEAAIAEFEHWGPHDGKKANSSKVPRLLSWPVPCSFSWSENKYETHINLTLKPLLLYNKYVTIKCLKERKMLIFQMRLVMEPKMVTVKAALSTGGNGKGTGEWILPRLCLCSLMHKFHLCLSILSFPSCFQIHPSLGHLSNIIASTHGKHTEAIRDGHYRGRNHSDRIFLGSGLKSWEGSHLWRYHVDSFKTQSAPPKPPLPFLLWGWRLQQNRFLKSSNFQEDPI